MKNIFAFAKFGDKFRTRDGRMAIFLQIDTILDEEGKDIGKLAYVYTLQDGEYSVALNGIGTSGDDIVLNNVNIEELNDDIVSEWREEIAEEELEDIAIDEGHELSRKYGYDNSLEDENIFIDGFKEGYRKAKNKEV